MIRHVLVTGAAGGIGGAIAREFAHHGAETVSLADLPGPRLDARASEIADIAATHAIPVDLTEPDAPESMLERAWRAGSVDVLVNAAGSYPSIDMLEVTAENWDRVFALNLRAPVLSGKAFAQRLIEAGAPGSIVHISSGAALRARPGGGPYASSKAALEMATRSSALELGEHGIRVNAVSPGFIAVHSECNPVTEEYAAAVGKNPLRRAGKPEDVAAAVRWISCDDAEWITGEVLRVDGGSSAGAAWLPRLWTEGAK